MTTSTPRRVAVGAMALGALLSTSGWTALTVDAASELDWFVAAPGYIRTNLETTVIAADAERDLVYAVTRSDERSRLVVVNTEDFTIEADADMTADVIVDLDVSDDGRTVYALTPDSAIRVDASALDVDAVINLSGPAEKIHASPDDPARFMTVGESSGSHLVYDGTDLVPDGSASIVGLHATFGGDADSLFVVDFDSTLNSIDLASGSLELVESRSIDLIFGTRVTDIAYDEAGVVVVIDALGAKIEVRGYQVPGLGTDTTVDASFDWMNDGRVKVLDTVNDRYIQTSGVNFNADGYRANNVRQSWSIRLRDAGVGNTEPLRQGRLAFTEFWSSTIHSTRGAYLTFADPDVLASPYGHLHPTTPSRVLDTREANGVLTARPVGPDTTVDVQISGRGAVPSTGVLAVAMNITITNPTAPSYVTVWPSGLSRPNVSNVNFIAGRTIANYATVPLGPDGAVQLYNRFGDVDVIFDVVGYYSDEDGERGATYEAIQEQRILDTRESTFAGSGGRVGAGEIVEVRLGQLMGDPIGSEQVVAAAINVTAAFPTEPSFLSVYPGDAERPTASTVNFVPGDVRANMVVTGVDSDGMFKIFNPFGEVDIVVDIFGLYVIHTEEWQWEGRLIPVRPFRAFDSRVSSPFDGSGALEPGSALIMPNSNGWTDLINVTAATTTADGFLSVIGYRRGDLFPRPLPTSNVNFRAGEVVANAVFATGAPDTAIINPFGFTHVVIDVFGYLTPFQLQSSREVWAPTTSSAD